MVKENISVEKLRGKSKVEDGSVRKCKDDFYVCISVFNHTGWLKHKMC